MRFRKFSFFVFVFFLFSSFSILSFSKTPEKKAVCKQDLEKFCAEKQSNQEEKVKCLKKHKDDLNPECLAKVDEVKDKMKSFKKDCKEDLKKFCDRTPSEYVERKNCLKQHESEVSGQCQAHLEVKKEKK